MQFTLRYTESAGMVDAVRNADVGDIIVPTQFNYPAIHAIAVLAHPTDAARRLYMCIQFAIALKHLVGPAAALSFVHLMTAALGDQYNRYAGILYFVPPNSYNSFTIDPVAGFNGRHGVMTIE